MRKFFTHNDAVVPVHHPRVVVETAVAQGASRAALYEGSGVSDELLANPHARISYTQFAVLSSHALRLTNNPALGLDVGRNTHMPQMGVYGLALMSSATVGDALGVLLRHHRNIAPALHMSFRVDGPRAILTLGEALPLLRFRAFATEILLAALDTQGRVLLGKDLPVRSLRFNYARPDYADRYAELYDVPTSFDDTETEVVFDSEILEAKVAFADPATAKLAEHYASEHLPNSEPPQGLVVQVRSRLDAAQGKPPTLDELARELHTSGRSLRRFLSQMGSSYDELLDASRKARALTHLRSGGLSFDELAKLLGFSDVRSFRRAFKRWTGQTPQQFRQQGT